MRRRCVPPRRWLRGSNHLGRQGRLAFMAWVSGLFSPSGFSPFDFAKQNLPPFSVKLLFCRADAVGFHPTQTSAEHHSRPLFVKRAVIRFPSHFPQAALFICFATPQRVQNLLLGFEVTLRKIARSVTMVAVRSNRYATLTVLKDAHGSILADTLLRAPRRFSTGFDTVSIILVCIVSNKGEYR